MLVEGGSSVEEVQDLDPGAAWQLCAPHSANSANLLTAVGAYTARALSPNPRDADKAVCGSDLPQARAEFDRERRSICPKLTSQGCLLPSTITRTMDPSLPCTMESGFSSSQPPNRGLVVAHAVF